jgi:hypothetical protein
MRRSFLARAAALYIVPGSQISLFAKRFGVAIEEIVLGREVVRDPKNEVLAPVEVAVSERRERRPDALFRPDSRFVPERE